MSEEKLEITMDDLYGAAVDTRIRGLMNLLAQEYPNAAIEEMLGVNGLPYISFTNDDIEVLMSYYPVDELDDEHYVLFLRSTIYMEEETDEALLLSCESFNIGSPFGFAVHDLVDNAVELRAQIPEIGGMAEAEYYSYMIDLFLYNRQELFEHLNGE